MTTHTFKLQDNGHSVAVVVGDRLTIELAENPTTGYRWRTPAPLGAALVLDSDEFVPASGSAIGGGGFRRFVFAVKSAGTITLHTANVRAWEKDAAGAATYTLTVVVTAATARG